MHDKARNIRWIGIGLIAVGVVHGVTLAGDLDPTGPPAPTMKPLDQLEARIPITSLPFTIDQPGSYFLAGILTGVTGMNGITVTVDDVTIDLNGYSLAGVAGSLDGIHVPTEVSSLSIRNGTIRDWGQDGIDATSANGSMIREVRTLDNGGFGIRIGSNDTTPPDRRSLVVHCTANGNGSGGILGGRGTSVFDSIASGNTGNGIAVSSEGIVAGCAADFNTADGIELGNNSTARGNNMVSNGAFGLEIDSRCFVVHNNAHGNGNSGNDNFNPIASQGANLVVDNNMP